ncbi:hypothetical protein PLESTB_001773800 [Pleodorina starrii]|uniref:Protein BCCIP homolog n=1 Tax=Pleodorina starrii TaxID=330485 RepID=A0A9W6FAE2_9CHLO|nr:hypothetical protein PLESTB_001773800 [Pleodorina starrii]GLC76988.1 hypothetical protein PLESTF_001864400 [Pleodorina starrii]
MPKRKAEAPLKRDEEEEEQQPDAAEDGDGSDSDGAGETVPEGDDDSGSGSSDDEDEGEDDDDDDSDDDGSDDDSCPEASSSEAESEDDEDGEAYKEVNVQFEFFDPQERDVLGLKALLNTYLDGQQYDCSGLVDAIIRQTAVGTVVKSSEEDDPFALLTAFNTARGPAASSPWLAQLRDYLAARCPDAATKTKLEQALAGPGTALLVSERLINCPPQLAPPLVQMLMEEIEGAATDEDYPKEEREEFSFQRYLHVTRVYTDPGEEAEGDQDAEGEAGAAAGGAGPSSSKPPPAPAPGAGRKGGKGKDPLIIYVRPEDEYLYQVCSWSFTFPVEGRPVAKGDLRPLRAVMCVEAGRVAEARAMMDLVVGNMMAEEEGEGQEAAAGAAAAGGKGRGEGGKGKAGKAAGQGKAGSKGSGR